MLTFTNRITNENCIPELEAAQVCDNFDANLKQFFPIYFDDFVERKFQQVSHPLVNKTASTRKSFNASILKKRFSSKTQILADDAPAITITVTPAQCEQTFRRSQKYASLNIDEVLLDSSVCLAFKKFAFNERSGESVVFIEEVHHFKTLQAKEQRLECAKRMISLFIEKNSVHEINITDKSRDLLQKQFQEQGPALDLFDNVVDELKLLTLRDCFNRFRKSE